MTLPPLRPAAAAGCYEPATQPTHKEAKARTNLRRGLLACSRHRVYICHNIHRHRLSKANRLSRRPASPGRSSQLPV
jgi:hypothetical protein